MSEFVDMKLNVPFIPDIVYWSAIKYGKCDLCRLEKDTFDNTDCPHCKKKTSIIQGCFSPKVKEV